MAQLFDETDLIPCNFCPVLIFAGAGLRKTTLGQTADKPLTLDFDIGIHRCSYRKQALQFTSWADHIAAGGNDGHYFVTVKDPKSGNEVKRIIDYNTLVVDTGGRALDLMIPGIIRESPKNGNPAGGLSPQGWGILGVRFTTWIKQIRAWGKGFVMLCHEEEDKNAAGNSFFKPDLPGKMSWKEVHKNFDMIGRIWKEGNKHYLNFSPTEFSVGKNAAGFDVIELPDQHDPNFLASLILQAKERIGKTAEASALINQAVEKTVSFLDGKPAVQDFNKWLAEELPKMTGAAKSQSWHLCQGYAKENSWAFDQQYKMFIGPPEPPAPATEQPSPAEEAPKMPKNGRRKKAEPAEVNQSEPK